MQMPGQANPHARASRETRVRAVSGAAVRSSVTTSQPTSIKLAMALGLAITLGGCAAGVEQFKSDMDLLAKEVRAMNAALMQRLRGLEDTGLTVIDNGETVSIVVPDVFFDFGSARLSADARSAIGEAAKLLGDDDYASYQISIEGHTDSKGSEKFNSKLSRERADAVEKELLFSSINNRRIVAVVGHGESNPVAENNNSDGSDNPEGRAKNRRVEIVLADPRLTSN